MCLCQCMCILLKLYFGLIRTVSYDSRSRQRDHLYLQGLQGRGCAGDIENIFWKIETVVCLPHMIVIYSGTLSFINCPCEQCFYMWLFFFFFFFFFAEDQVCISLSVLCDGIYTKNSMLYAFSLARKTVVKYLLSIFFIFLSVFSQTIYECC